jgi:hypothetical protein
MDWLIITLLAFSLLAIVRKLHHYYATLKFKYAVYELRDMLRFAAIEGKINKKSFVFSYLDSTFSKAVKQSYFITLFHIITSGVIHEKDESLKEALSNLYKEVNKNSVAKKLLKDFTKAGRNYVFEQHYVSMKVHFHLKKKSK